MLKTDITTEDYVYWCPRVPATRQHIWYAWGGPEFRRYKDIHQDEKFVIFCCIKNGLFHYIEDFP